jgi:phage N-6-adenine-methyltransferase
MNEDELQAQFSSGDDEWSTPQRFFDGLNAEFGFTLDPCSTDQNAKCKKHFTAFENGLVQNWSNDIVFMNPPYGRHIGRWMKKAYDSAKMGATVVCLIPARTDTHWWHTYAMRGEIRLLYGRLKFGDAKNSAPFPSAVVVFRPPGFQLRAVPISLVCR